MKLRIAALALGLTLITTSMPGHSSETNLPPRFYGGLQLGRFIEDDGHARVVSRDVLDQQWAQLGPAVTGMTARRREALEPQDPGLGIMFGINVNRIVSLQLDYLIPPSTAVTTFGSSDRLPPGSGWIDTVTLRSRVLELSGIARWPLPYHFSLYGRVGVTRSRTVTSADLCFGDECAGTSRVPTVHYELSHSEMIYGTVGAVGLQLRHGSPFSVALEYARTRVPDGLGNGMDLSKIALSVVFAPGQRTS